MRRLFVVALLVLVAPCTRFGQARDAQSQTPRASYGFDPAGRTFTHDGVKAYYETYGAGEPLLLVHGNGGSIADFGAQIDHFRTRYRVIGMDSRDQGRSGDSAGPITYEKMADDLAALLDELHAGPVNVLGWSDGAIEALLLGIRQSDKVKKIAALAANLNPSAEATYPEVLTFARSLIDSVPPAAKCSGCAAGIRMG